MKTILIVLLSATTLVCCNQTNTSYDSAIRLSKDSINSLMEKGKIPGLAVTVVVEGKVTWSEGFGHADLENDVHVNPTETRFRIGSISKALTAAGLAKLYEQQKIVLDSSLYFYLPDYPKYKYRPTVRQLAGHIAGIRHYKGDEFYNKQLYKKVADGLAMFKNDSLLFRPGERFEYTAWIRSVERSNRKSCSERLPNIYE